MCVCVCVNFPISIEFEPTACASSAQNTNLSATMPENSARPVRMRLRVSFSSGSSEG